MNLSESLAQLRNQLDLLTLTEAFQGGHAPHPEDYVFLKGKQGAIDAKNAILATIKNPESITLKWDGYPALIFGRGTDGKFIIADKHMFNRSDGSGRIIHSPDEFKNYDLARGKDRSELLNYVTNIWGDLERASQGSSGYYWGDFLYYGTTPLQSQSKQIGDRTRNVYTFKANPNGVEYNIDVDSNIGQLIQGKPAVIAVHMKLPADAADRAAKEQAIENKKAEKEGRKPHAIKPTDLSQSLGGGIGQLKNNTNIAILPSKMTQEIKLVKPEKEIANVDAAISKYGNTLDEFLKNSPIPAENFRENLIGVFINHKVNTDDGTGRNLQSNLAQDFYDWAKNRSMPKRHQALLFGYEDPKTGEMVEGYLNQNIEGIQAFFMIWLAVYQLKMAVWRQLDSAEENSPVTGILGDNSIGQEGYVASGVKFVNRPKFSRLNAQARLKK